MRALVGCAALLVGIGLSWPGASRNPRAQPGSGGLPTNGWMTRDWLSADFAARAFADAVDAPFTMEPEVVLSAALRRTVTQLAVAFRAASQRSFHVTSGVRTPLEQAEAMFDKLANGSRLTGLYRDYDAALELEQAYRRTRRSGKPECVAAMARVLNSQIARGLYISRHLYSGAVDVRSRDMTSRERRTFRVVVAGHRSARVLEEGRPPHFHVEFPVSGP